MLNKYFRCFVSRVLDDAAVTVILLNLDHRAAWYGLLYGMLSVDYGQYPDDKLRQQQSVAGIQVHNRSTRLCIQLLWEGNMLTSSLGVPVPPRLSYRLKRARLDAKEMAILLFTSSSTVWNFTPTRYAGLSTNIKQPKFKEKPPTVSHTWLGYF